MHNKVVSAVFTIIGFLLMIYAILLVLNNDFHERCYQMSDGDSYCEGGMAGAGPMALLAIASMVAGVATRPVNKPAAVPAQRVEPYVDRPAVPPRSWRASGYAASGTGAAVDCS